MKEYDLIIAGAGISGMSMAYFAVKRGLEVLVLEREEKTGGAFATASVNEGEYWLELGAHTCYNTYGNLIDIIEGCGITSEMIPRAKAPYVLHIDGKIKSVFSKINIPEILISIPKIFFAPKEGKSVAEYYSKVLGRRNYDNLMQYMFNAVLSQRTNDFPADLLFRKRPKRKDILRSFTFKQGLKSITDAIEKLDNIEVRKDVAVENLSPEKGGYLVHGRDGQVYQAKHVALCTPAAASSLILKKHFNELSKVLSQTKTASIISQGVIVDQNDLNLKQVSGIISPNDNFYSVVSRDTVPHPKYRGFTFHFKPEVSLEADRLDKIAAVLGMDKQKFVAHKSTHNSVPSLTVGHHQWVEKTDAILKKTGLLLSGNSFLGVSIEDCVSRSRAEIDRVFK